MDKNTPTLEEWRGLYEAMARVKEIAPWEWMEETDVFGVQDPETDELGFVSVMGTLGEHYAIAVYLGARGLYDFWGLQDAGPLITPEQLLEVPQLQASFEDRDQLHAKDREKIKELGLKFRGRQTWPLFRSYCPGFYPWFLEAGETRFLTHALQQIFDVAPRFREAPSLLEPSGDDSYLVRVPRREGDTLVWADQIVQVPLPESSSIQIRMDVRALEHLKGLPQSRNKIEIDLFIMPVALGERGTRPHFPYMVLSVEAESGFVLGSDVLTADPSLEEMWGLVPMKVVYHLARVGINPGEVSVRTLLLLNLLQPLADEVGFRLNHSHSLPSLDAAKEFILGRF
jgi:hypothetical protein